MTLQVVLWKWTQPNFRETYSAKHVNIVSRMIRDNLQGVDLRIICITDDEHYIDPPTEVFPLWTDHDNLANITGRHLPSCYRRLKLFDHETQKSLGFKDGDRLISIDLDAIIVAPLNDVVKHIERMKGIYSGWGVPGTYHRMVFNGSFWSIKAGPELQSVWSTFQPLLSPRVAMSKGFLGSDQGWMSMLFAQRNDVCPIRYPEFASYPREVKRTGLVDKRTKIVFFHGSRKPWHPQEQKSQPWITKYWR